MQPESTPETITATAKPAEQTGIDIQKALDILAIRSSNDDDHDHDHSHGGCHAHQTDDLRSMGQTIDLTATADTNPSLDDPSGNNEVDAEALKKEQEERRKERLAKMQAELESMNVKELLQTVLDAQQQRVVTYQGCNEGLNQILQSGNMTDYINNCAHTTAAFAVLSETINAVRSVLASPAQKRKDLEKQLTNLQQHEKEKLNLTAAYHLERIRERNENISNANVDKADKRISQLLTQGVQSLKQKIDACVEQINETIEEIRYALIEEDEENEAD